MKLGLGLRVRFKRLKRCLGYDERNWLRVRQIDAWTTFLSRHPRSEILEISPGANTTWSRMHSKSYSSLQYPEFDISKQSISAQFDIVIADQVLEHVLDAETSMANIFAMVRPGGFAMIASPFLFRVHARPNDYHRWTEPGLRWLCERAGFGEVVTDSWGNKACVRAHIGGPVRDLGFGRDMSNDPEYPIMVWAIARR